MERRDSALDPDVVRYYLRLGPEPDLPYELQPKSNRANLSEFQFKVPNVLQERVKSTYSLKRSFTRKGSIGRQTLQKGRFYVLENRS